MKLVEQLPDSDPLETVTLTTTLNLFVASEIRYAILTLPLVFAVAVWAVFLVL